MTLPLLFFGLGKLPCGESMTIFYTAPIFALLFGTVFLGKRVSHSAVFAVLLSLAGVVLLAAPWQVAEQAQSSSPSGTIAGIEAMVVRAVFGGLSVTVTRVLMCNWAAHYLSSVLA